MDPGPLIARLERFPAALGAVAAGLADADWRWRPAEGGWSLLEVARHLLDEEVEDFRARLDAVLAGPSRAWPSLDPEGAVLARAYNEADPADTLRRFAAERARSVAWLRGLRDPRWDAARVLSKGPPLAAGDLLASWVAHDARHLAQVGKRLHGLAARDAVPYSVGYAG
jgi:hypothetical protein